MKKAIIIMAKVPIAGSVKTRLQPEFTPDESAELAACFLLDSLKKAQLFTENTILSYSPRGGETTLRELIGDAVTTIVQSGEDLGERISHSFEIVFAQDFDSVLMIGTDSPTLSIEILETAFSALKTADSVIGETFDGGFYLIGLHQSNHKIFKDIEWSTPKVFSQTNDNLEKLGLNVSRLPILYDIDTPEDIELLMSDKVFEINAPNTFNYLSTKKDAKQ
jgi:uncharacterized protein